MRVPCYQCPRRAEGCHATCPDYQEYSANRKRMREAIMIGKEATQTVLRGKKDYLDRIAVREKRRGRKIR